MRSILLPIASVTLAACGAPLDKARPMPVDGEVLHLDWSLGQEFHLASTVRHTAVGGGSVGAPLEVDLELAPSPEAWSTEAVWSVQVVEHDTIPDADDVLYDYAFDAAGRAVPLSVLRAEVDSTLNGDAELLELNPVVYLVFRSDSDRLAGIVEFTTVDGERRSRALSSHDLNRSTGTLTQAHLAALPTYLAPWGSRWGDGERVLEDGSRALTERIEDGVTDVFFDDGFGGGGVALRYEAGQPWPVWTVSDNAETRLLSEDELASWPLAQITPTSAPPPSDTGALPPPPDAAPEDFDFRAALTMPLNMDAAFHLSEEVLESGEYSVSAYEGFRPWAGYWWPLTDGELVLGYSGEPTFSDRIQAKVDPLHETIEAERKKYEAAKTDDERNAAGRAYNAARTELVQLLLDYYDGIQAGLDGGTIRIENSVLIKDATADDSAWYYPLDQLSPMDKWSVVEYLRDTESGNPFRMSAWEYLNSYAPGGESWWGHCNGWAAAAILTNEPRETRSVHVGGHHVRFTAADQKGLLSEAHYSIDSRFFGTRYDGEDDDVSDLSPADFHRVVGFYLDQQGVPFVMDTTATEQVWNFPAWKVDIQLTPVEGGTSVDGRVNVNTASLEQLMTVPGMTEDQALAILDARAAGGAFQSLSELYGIKGMHLSNLDDLFTLDSSTRIFDARAVVKITTDAVGATHVDGVPDLPQSEEKVWDYTIEVDDDGRILGGSWKDDRSHPDFVWVPLVNPRGRDANETENPYLVYGNYLDELGADIER